MSSMKNYLKFTASLSSVLATLLSSQTALAQGDSASMPEDFYEKALQAAQRKVDQKKALERSSAGALSSTMIKSLFGRYYQVGDSWEVAAWRSDTTLMRKLDHVEQPKPKFSQSGIFRYEVSELRNGPEPKIILKVTQLQEHGMRIQDRKVQELTLVMTDRLSQTQKEYRFLGQDQPVRVSPEGLRSAITPLELFPLDVPELFSATRENARTMPELPQEAQALAQQVGFKPDLSKSSWFEQDDFFGRPVQVLWQKGDPWPAYLKTTHGVAILIRGAS